MRGFGRSLLRPLIATIALIATSALAVSMGQGGKSSVALHGLAFATWLVFLLIVDLDQPRRGWIQVSQEPLLQLQRSAQPSVP